MKITELKKGDRVIVSHNWGAGPRIEGTIDEIDDNIKNGRPGIIYIADNGECYWAYIDQVIKKVS